MLRQLQTIVQNAAVLFAILLPGVRLLGSDRSLLVDEGFEHADLYHDAWWSASGNSNGRSTSAFAREGRRAARFCVELAVEGDYRSEVTTGGDNPGPRTYKIGHEYWYGISILPAPELRPAPRAEVVLQFHNTPDAGDSPTLNPVVALRCDGRRWLLDVRGDSKKHTKSPADYEFLAPDMDMGPVEVGAWTDWVLAIKWSPRADGRVRLWKNGELVYEGTHANCYNDTRGPYLKFGVYAWYLRPHRQEERRLAVEQSAGDRVYYYDSVRIAGEEGDFALVSPRTPQPDHPGASR